MGSQGVGVKTPSVTVPMSKSLRSCSRPSGESMRVYWKPITHHFQMGSIHLSFMGWSENHIEAVI
jgi:hypothetical protein